MGKLIEPVDRTENVTSAVSSASASPEIHYLAIGRVVRAHGVRGELSVAVLTDFPERFQETEWIYVGDELEAQSYRIEKYRWHKKNILLSLDGVVDRTQAEQLRGQFIQIPIEEAMPLPDGDYYRYQFVNVQVVTTKGDVLGRIADIMETGANDVFIIKNEAQQEVLIPFIPDVVKEIDLEQDRVVVELIDGLI